MVNTDTHLVIEDAHLVTENAQADGDRRPTLSPNVDYPSAYFATQQVGKYSRAELRRRWLTHPEERPAILVFAVYNGWMPAPEGSYLQRLYPRAYEINEARSSGRTRNGDENGAAGAGSGHHSTRKEVP
jgi:hypothetical protein